MTFADVRKAVLNACALSTDFWAETVEIVDGDSSRTCTVKVEHEQLGKRIQTAGGNQVPSDQTLDELERIRVTFSRDPNFAGGGMPRKPNVGSGLLRSSDRDSDRRPFAFAGEVDFEGDQHAVYIYQRTRRVSQGRRL